MIFLTLYGCLFPINDTLAYLLAFLLLLFVVVVVAGIALTGDPDFDIFRASAPYATKRAVSMLSQRMTTTRTSASTRPF
jgi:predicted unusual protein kinase regulating ubiquinone biosynthesis (AarF/ABC1/UbiB family)